MVAPGPKHPATFRVADNSERRAILDRTAGIHELCLAQDFATGQLGKAPETDERSAANMALDSMVNASVRSHGQSVQNGDASHRPWPPLPGNQSGAKQGIERLEFSNHKVLILWFGDLRRWKQHPRSNRSICPLLDENERPSEPVGRISIEHDRLGCA